MHRVERVVLAVMLTGLVAGPAAAQMAPPSGPNASQAPTPPLNRVPAPGQEQRLEGVVESIQGESFVLKTPNERFRVDASQIGDVRQSLRAGQEVAVVGVVGPERETIRAKAIQQPSAGARDHLPATLPRQEESKPPSGR